jgi:hypothetical protein
VTDGKTAMAKHAKAQGRRILNPCYLLRFGKPGLSLPARLEVVIRFESARPIHLNFPGTLQEYTVR